MNKLQFKGEWHELKGKLRQKFADLTDNDLDYAEGQEEEFLGHLKRSSAKAKTRSPSWLTLPRYQQMLNYAITFFIIAIVAAFLGFSGIAGSAAGIAQILFFVFLVIAVISFLNGRRGVM